MTPIFVSMPFACFRTPLSSEYIATDYVPTPATCYGFLLSLVGEKSMRRHIGVKISPGYLKKSPKSVLFKQLRRVRMADVKDPITGEPVIKMVDGKPVLKKGKPQARQSIQSVMVPDRQEVLSNVELCLWVDSSKEKTTPTLEERVLQALAHPETISRFGGLSLGESQFLVNRVRVGEPTETWQFLSSPQGFVSLPVWVDHVSGKNSIYAIGDLRQVVRPDVNELPTIRCAF